MDYQQRGALWRLTGGGRETARTDMETYLNTWLVGLSVEVDGTEIMVYYLVSATDLAQAESGVLEMGRIG